MASSAGVEPTTRQPMVLAVCILAMVVSTLIVVVRLVMRRTVLRRYFVDDALIFLANISIVMYATLVLIGLEYRLGNSDRENIAMTMDDTRRLGELLTPTSIAYACAVACLRLSVINTFLRVLPYQQLRVVLLGSGVIVTAQFIASMPLIFFECTPLQTVVNMQSANGPPECIDFRRLWLPNTVVHVLLDVVLLLAPLPFLTRLGMNTKNKILMALAFLLGAFACVCTLLRLMFSVRLRSSNDFIYDAVPPLFFALAETVVGLAAISLPQIRFLVLQLIYSPPSRFRQDHSCDSESASRYMPRDDNDNKCLRVTSTLPKGDSIRVLGHWSAASPGSPTIMGMPPLSRTPDKPNKAYTAPNKEVPRVHQRHLTLDDEIGLWD